MISMRKASFDPGLTEQYTGKVRRVIQRDGGLNVLRRGGNWRDFHAYLLLINMSWPQFFAMIVGAYLLVNTLFAEIYYLLGPDQLQGENQSTNLNRFLAGFFFSAHTLTTVGYGSIAPKALAANIVAVIESMAGVLGFAVATGLLFGRVSRPSAKIGFSETMVVAPYQDGTSLQFRVANRRSNQLMEVDARVMLMTVVMRDGVPVRKYVQLKLEREQVLFLALTWTIVHPIESDSPLYGLTAEDLAQQQAEFVVSLKAFDDTFSQTVFARYSYRHDEVQWGKRFAPAFGVNQNGDMVVELDRLGAVKDAV
jgi:inward rectifier potassium channel